jgi:hypothetical protein
MSGRWREDQATKYVNIYKDSENLCNVFTLEYKNREARLASLEHTAREMNISTEQGQLNWSTVYPIAVNNNGQSNCLSSRCRPVGNPATVKLASQ